MFNSINGLHITFITTISVFFKEFVYFLYDYFEHFKLKDSSFIQETNKCEDTIKNLNKDNESGESSNTENKPSEASGSGVQPESSYAYGSGGKSIAEDLRNYQIDSDSDYDPADYGFSGEHHGDPYNSESEAENDKAGINRALVENIPVFEENIKKTEDSESLKDLKKELNEVIDIYKSGTSPSAKQEIAQIEKKIDICDNRISELEAESNSKGKGKGN